MDTAIALLQRYNFDLGGYTIGDLQRSWSRFKPEWLRHAAIEALFQGRYKAVSVNQILELWERRGEPQHRYNREFERLVCDDVTISPEISPTMPQPNLKVPVASSIPNPDWQYQKLKAISNTSESYAIAYANITLLAESSLFVDKLRSMCSDRPITLETPEPETFIKQ